MSVVTDVLNWLHSLPQPALVGAIGGLVFLKFALGIGIGSLAPGESGMIIAATTATTPARFLILWLVATTGATLGNMVAYAVGRRWGPGLRESRLLRRYGVDAWDGAVDMLRRRGPWAVAVGPFLPLIRALPPLAAGTSGLPVARFLPATAAGSLCWCLVHVVFGVALGAAVTTAESTLNTGGLIAVGILAAIGIFLLYRKKRRKKLPEAATSGAARTRHVE